MQHTRNEPLEVNTSQRLTFSSRTIFCSKIHFLKLGVDGQDGIFEFEVRLHIYFNKTILQLFVS